MRDWLRYAAQGRRGPGRSGVGRGRHNCGMGSLTREVHMDGSMGPPRNLPIGADCEGSAERSRRHDPIQDISSELPCALWDGLLQDQESQAIQKAAAHNSAQYKQWLQQGARKGMRPLFRALSAEDAVLCRPYQDLRPGPNYGASFGH